MKTAAPQKVRSLLRSCFNRFVFGSVACMGFLAQSTSAAPIPTLLREVEAKYSKAKTIQAKFEQVSESAHLKRKKISTGSILIKSPDKIRWETLTPDKNLLISDGKKFWFYTPPFDAEENGQLIERKKTDIRSELTSALMTGSFSKAKQKGKMQITIETPSQFMLKFDPGSAGTIAQAKILVDQKEKLIRKITLFHSDGNTAEITLSEIELGKPADDALFQFTPPARTDIIQE